MSNKITILLFFILQSCGDSCSRDVCQTALSQNGVLNATSLVVNCGATTNYVLEAYVGPVGKNYNEGVLIFRGEGDKITVDWKNDKELNIITDAKPNLLMKQYFDVHFLLNGE
jgi:hypothetical protein